MADEFAFEDSTGEDEPIDCFSKDFCGTSFLCKLILKLLVLFCQLCRNRVPAGLDFDCGCWLGIFAHVGVVSVKNGLLN